MKIHDESIEQVIEIAEDAIMEGDSKNGKRMLMNVLFEEPGYAKVHATLAWMYRFYKEDERLARRHYQLAVYFDPENNNHFRNLCEFYLDKKWFNDLESLLTKALDQKKAELDFVYDNLGRIREREGQFKEAISYYQKALEHCMDNDEVQELKQTIKRTRFKRFKNRIRKMATTKLTGKELRKIGCHEGVGKSLQG